MKIILEIILYSFFSGITVFLGGILSKAFERFKNHSLHKFITHFAIAFGGGILIAAVAFVLLPKGIEQLSLFPLILSFVGGVLFFCFLDNNIHKKGGSFAQMMAMLMDFVPEAIALGGVFAHNLRLGLLLAVYIGLQNLPESFNSYIELKHYNHSSKKSLTILFFLSFTGIIAALMGYYLLREKPGIIASLMVFSGGGIVFLMFQDIAPLSKIRNSWIPAIGASIGFLVGVIGEKLLG
jgi:ZIP family zinc transporter